MDIQDLKNHARITHDHAVAKKNLKERMQARLIVAHRGGVFNVTPELFMLLDLVGDSDQSEDLVLIDAYGTPIQVTRDTLRAEASKRYREITNEWLHEWNLLKRIRRAEDV